MHLLETRDLSHHFSPEDPVLKGVNIAVEKGAIYGFLGPNGAGKTTTLRLILGLLKKQRGEVLLFGKDHRANRLDALRKIGSLIESPSIYGHLTAVENLALLQKIYQCPKERITEVLELVGLPDTRSKRAGQFSLGMKQRLSIALALLHSPSLLILDEPTNGLDPNGMIEVRELLKRLNSEHGITILVSSHLLSEVDKLVTHIGIINKGQMVFQGTLEELKQQQQRSTHVVLESSDSSKTIEILDQYGLTATLVGEKFNLPVLPRELIGKLNRSLVEAGVEVYELGVVKNDLERIFIDMVSN